MTVPYADNDFGIYAYHRSGRQPEVAGEFMNDQYVSRKDESSPWIYTPVKYWPTGMGDKIFFYGYSPYGCASGGLDGEGRFLLEFESSEDADVDLIVAATGGLEYTSAAVNLPFRHVLAKVEFWFKISENVSYSNFVTGVGLKESNLKGKYDPDQGEWVDWVKGYQEVPAWGELLKDDSRLMLTVYYIPPKTITELDIYIDGTARKCTLTTPIELTANSQTILKFNVTPYDITGGDFTVVECTDWVQGSAIAWPNGDSTGKLQ